LGGRSTKSGSGKRGNVIKKRKKLNNKPDDKKRRIGRGVKYHCLKSGVQRAELNFIENQVRARRKIGGHSWGVTGTACMGKEP